MKKKNVVAIIAGVMVGCGGVFALLNKIRLLNGTIKEQEEYICEQQMYIDLLEEDIEEDNELIDSQAAEIEHLRKCAIIRKEKCPLSVNKRNNRNEEKHQA